MSWVSALFLAVATALPPAAGVPSAEAPPRITLRVTPAAMMMASVDVAEIERALELRLHGSGLTYIALSEARADDWVVVVDCERQSLIVGVASPNGGEVIAGRVSALGRSSGDLAHTVVLLVSNVLAPIFPELGGVAPSFAATASPPAPPPPPEAQSHDELLTGAWLGGTVLFPDGARMLGVGGLTRLTRGRLVLELGAAVWDGPRAAGQGYTLDVRQLTLRAAGGAAWQLGPSRLSLTAGPALRVYWARVHADGATSADSGGDPAASAQVSLTTPVGPIVVFALVEGLYALRFPRFVVAGARAASLGQCAGAFAIGIAYPFSL